MNHQTWLAGKSTWLSSMIFPPERIHLYARAPIATFDSFVMCEEVAAYEEY